MSTEFPTEPCTNPTPDSRVHLESRDDAITRLRYKLDRAREDFRRLEGTFNEMDGVISRLRAGSREAVSYPRRFSDPLYWYDLRENLDRLNALRDEARAVAKCWIPENPPPMIVYELPDDLAGVKAIQEEMYQMMGGFPGGCPPTPDHNSTPDPRVHLAYPEDALARFWDGLTRVSGEFERLDGIVDEIGVEVSRLRASSSEAARCPRRFSDPLYWYDLEDNLTTLDALSSEASDVTTSWFPDSPVPMVVYEFPDDIEGVEKVQDEINRLMVGFPGGAHAPFNDD